MHVIFHRFSVILHRVGVIMQQESVRNNITLTQYNITPSRCNITSILRRNILVFVVIILFRMACHSYVQITHFASVGSAILLLELDFPIWNSRHEATNRRRYWKTKHFACFLVFQAHKFQFSASPGFNFNIIIIRGSNSSRFLSSKIFESGFAKV